MPRGKKHQYALAEDGSGGLAPVRVDGGSGRVQDVPGVPDGSDRTELAGFALQALLLRTDGWLRVIPCGIGKSSFFKWKYNMGRWHNHYVMYVAPYNDWSGGILGLYEKVQEVDTGTRKPAMDTFYDPR